MNSNKKHSDINKLDEQSKAIFSNGEFKWSKSKDEVWDELMQKIDEPSKKQTLRLYNNRFMLYSIAASIAFFISITAFMKLYTVNIEAPAGIHQQAMLPDGSSIDLNAGTQISYKPYWWHFSREVSLSGEAFFRVKKGKKFRVISHNATTEVLGTSFNIYARNTNYEVTCVTGSVKVTSKENIGIILKPSTSAKLIDNGNFNVKHHVNVHNTISWRDNIFVFNSTPIHNVLNEIARQYNVNITAKLDTMMLYTGNFTKKQEIESILGYICPALGLEYSKIGNNSYRIKSCE